MKNLFDNYVTVVIFTIMIFTLTSFGVLQMQILCARHLHNAIIDVIQSSYFNVNIDDINNEIKEKFPDWYVVSETLKTIDARQSRLVTLHYNVILPIFGVKQDGIINGYAK